ncbi:hypothetical protein PAXINDRAFT_166519 [Paxillus involutus ATCC 200175]|nr:hypothetical protein PAXINDRAFT_166519 [Paxillus involutus ATCC 200175]
MSKSDPSFLDVEDEDQRQKRIGSLLEKLNVNQATSTSATTNSLLNITDDKPGPIPPPSELLARVQAFLPTIEASNEALAQKNPEDIDIENVAEHEEQYIEMNLGLGVFESKRPKTGSASEDASSSEESESDSNSDFDSESSAGSKPNCDTDDDESSSDSELNFYIDRDQSSSDSESGDDFNASRHDDNNSDSSSGSSVHMRAVVSRPIKPLPRRVSQRADIQVLSSLPAPERDTDVT